LEALDRIAELLALQPRLAEGPHENLHVRGYREEGTTTTLFDMALLNQLDRFDPVNDVINRVPKLGARAAYAQQAIREKLIDHKHFIARHGDDLPEVVDWKWADGATAGRAADTTRGQYLTEHAAQAAAPDGEFLIRRASHVLTRRGKAVGLRRR
jgi:hypothetical protein